MKIGLVISPIYPSSLATQGLALAESIGADSVWTVDHLMGTSHPLLFAESSAGRRGVDPDAFFDPFCLIAAIAPRTSIPLGVGVTDSIRRGAADLARLALSLQHLCPGGFKLGIGSGEAANLLPFGYSFDRPVARCEQVLSQLRHLLDGGSFPAGNGRIGLPRESEAGRPEIWVAGHGPRMLRLTGQYGDGWYPAWPMTPEEYGHKRATIAGHADAAGRPPLEYGFQSFAIIGESLEHLEAQFSAEPLAKLTCLFMPGDAWARHGVEHPLGNDCRGFIDVIAHELDPEMLRALAPTIPFALLREGMFMGNVEDLMRQLEPYATHGMEHVILANRTGMVGGPEEAAARAPDLVRLTQLLREL